MPLAELTVTQPGQRPLKIEVSDSLISIGRRPDNVVCLAEDTNVSKYHAVIEGRGDGYWVSDLGSSNGTTVNGAEVTTEHRIENGDVISIGGSSTVEFRLLDSLPHAVARPLSEERPSPGGNVTGADSLPAEMPNAPPKTGGLSLVLVAGVVGGLIVTGAIIAVLFGSGVLGDRSRAGKEKPGSANGPGQSSDVPAAQDANGAGDDDDSTAAEVDQSEVDESTDTSASASDPELMAGIADDNDADASGLPAIPTPLGGASASTVQTTNLVEKLAAQISQKNVHRFDPQFIELINNYVAEYRADPTYFERAQRHRDAINTEFTNKHVNPLLGYVMAMTLSKFNEKA
ncbi:MAG: FHA domain-containing protein, partial [Acidobacteriota bacterium]|nr:FHA domain-containing protein [Acidobacteriota bacterium]